jgi:hypothetical protein
VRDQVSHPYKTTGKIIVLYILIFSYIYYPLFLVLALLRVECDF